MDQETWDKMSQSEKDLVRDNSDLSPQLLGLEGWRVEVVSNGEKHRFIVGKSTGYKPCHLEVHNRRSMGGIPAMKTYESVTKLRKVY